MPNGTCSVQDCERVARTKGWCQAHYLRWWKHGDPDHGGPLRKIRPIGMTESETFAWFMTGTPPAAGCWDWTGVVNSTGYGRFSVGHDPVDAHVASHRIYNTHDPVTDENPFVLHSCDRPICVQPKHLHSGTPAENIKEAVERGRVAHGERASGAKLTESDVLWIRAQTGMKHREMAGILGVSMGTIGFILRGETWKHLL